VTPCLTKKPSRAGRAEALGACRIQPPRGDRLIVEEKFGAKRIGMRILMQ
jgi:hypothetical protein